MTMPKNDIIYKMPLVQKQNMWTALNTHKDRQRLKIIQMMEQSHKSCCAFKDWCVKKCITSLMTRVTGLTAHSSLTSRQQFLIQRNGSKQILCWQGNTVECLHCRCRHAISSGSRSRSLVRMIRVMWWTDRVHSILMIRSKLWLSFGRWNGVQHVGLRLLSYAICTEHTHSDLQRHYTSHDHSRTASVWANVYMHYLL